MNRKISKSIAHSIAYQALTEHNKKIQDEISQKETELFYAAHAACLLYTSRCV